MLAEAIYGNNLPIIMSHCFSTRPVASQQNLSWSLTQQQRTSDLRHLLLWGKESCSLLQTKHPYYKSFWIMLFPYPCRMAQRISSLNRVPRVEKCSSSNPFVKRKYLVIHCLHKNKEEEIFLKSLKITLYFGI